MALFGTSNAHKNAAASSSDSPPRSDDNNNSNATSSSPDSHGKTKDNSPSRETDCSFASSNNPNNFSLDLSIGARAALAEHRRHVARFGIDGDGDDNGNGNVSNEFHRPPVESVLRLGTPQSGGGGSSGDRSSLSTLRGSPGEGTTKNDSSSSSSKSKTKNSPNKHSPPRDEWERFNDGSTHVSFASTFIVHGGDIDDDADDSNELHNVSNIMLGRSFLSDASHDWSGEGMKGDRDNGDNNNADDAGNESSADSSPNRSDYFNSSRVHLLATPERNKPIVDEASRRARQMANNALNGTEAIASGNRGHHHVTGRGNALEDDDNGVFEDTASSFIGVDDSTIGGEGSTIVGDVSGGMAFLFREAMRLNASAASNENGDSLIDSRSGAGREMEYSDNDEGDDDFDASRVNMHSESSPSKSVASSFASSFAGFRSQNGSNCSKGGSFVETDGGIEFVADISDILSTTRTPSRKFRGSPGTSSGSGSGNSHQKHSADSFSTPGRNSPSRHMRQASPKYNIQKVQSDRDKENVDEFNSIALSPIAARAGSEAAKLQSAGSFQYANTGGNIAKGSTPPRTPLRQVGSSHKHKVGATTASKIARNGGLAPTPERGEPMLSSFLNDSNLSVSMIEGNDQSLLLTHGISPLRGAHNEDAETTPERLTRSNSFGSPGDSERRRRRNHTSTEAKSRSRSVDSPGRRTGMHSDLLPHCVVKSLGARYSQPDRFEDNFSPVSATQESTELKSVSRSLLESFEA